MDALQSSLSLWSCSAEIWNESNWWQPGAELPSSSAR